MQIIQHDKIPTPKGHYSPIIAHNGLLYFSGQLPRNPTTGMIPEGIEAQTHQVLANIEDLLHLAGCKKSDVLQMRVYVADIQLWEQVNAIYTLFFGEHKPVRTIVPTGPLHYGCLLEIEATAVLPQPL
ncbi:MAG: RidA family protein [Saprospiraceae bacterium]|nr:RidA family protein [Saprospiraceae bacterium]